MSDTTTDALATGLLSVETARRVGWAKAYSYREQRDEAVKDAAMWRSDRESFQVALSFTFGLFIEWAQEDRSELFREILTELAGVDAVMDDKLIAAGRKRARQIREADAVWQEEKELAKAAHRGNRWAQVQDQHSRLWKGAKKNVLRSLVEKYGFHSSDEMHDVLAKWQAASGRRREEPEA